MKENKENKENIVVYKNDFNSVPLRNFNSIEMDLLFTIMSKMKDKGLNEVEFTFEELKELSNYKPTSTSRFVSDLERTYDKLISLNVKIGTSRKWTKFVFFTHYSVDSDFGTINVKVNEEFQHLINQISGNFTKLELEEITTLKSSYSKSMYRLLKQFRSTGFVRFEIENFRNLLDIPDSYKMGNIDQQILKPIMRELPEYFEDLECKKIRGKGKDKRKIGIIEFTFNPQYDRKEIKGQLSINKFNKFNYELNESYKMSEDEREEKLNKKILELTEKRNRERKK